MENEQEIRNEFRRLVTIGCNPECKTYEEIIRKEKFIIGNIIIDPKGIEYRYCGEKKDVSQWCNTDTGIIKDSPIILISFGLPITIGRVVQAFWNRQLNLASKFNGTKEDRVLDCRGNGEIGYLDVKGVFLNITHWKLTKDGKECTDDDQKIQTIKELLKIIK